MKKIILFSMAAMLLSLSLNAQLVPDNTKRSIKASKTLQSNSINAPKITLGDDEYYLGPYANDTYTRASTSLGNFTSGQVQVGVVLEANEFSQYYGDQIVGFRFATANTYSATVYNFFCTFISERYIGVTGSWSSSFGTNGTSMTSGWHEYHLQEPIDFTPADSVVQMWIGYEYNQRSSTNNAYNVVAVNTSSTSHEDLVYMSYSGSYGFYDLESYLGGDVAVQLIMKRKPQPVFEGYTELPGTYSPNQNIVLDDIAFCDQPSGDTHANEHPSRYTYWLEEVLEEGSTDTPHKTNSIDFPVYKTGSKVNGYYTAAEVAGDTNHQLALDVINADVEMSLLNESMIYYYTLDRGKTTLPTENNCIARLQNNANGNFYTEMSDALNYLNETYTSMPSAPAQIHRWDHVNVETGTHNQDYMAYIPVIWSWGDGTFDNKRNDWWDEIPQGSRHVNVHNSYGSPYYKTGVGDVSFNASTRIIAQTDGLGTTWTDGTDECCLYNVVMDVNGYLPTTVNSVQYEPYWFRVWVEGSGLRGIHIVYKPDGDPQYVEGDGTSPSEVLLYDGPAPSCMEPNISRLSQGSEVAPYTSWITFGGLQNFTPRLRARFYYKVAEENAATLRAGEGQDSRRLFYAVEESDYQPQIQTGIIECFTGAQVVGTTYVNMQGMQSSTPFDGVNIVVTRYSDGTTTTAKVVK